MIMVLFYFLESGNKDSEAAAYERGNKDDAEDEEETPPPLPPRRRLEAADEPEAKKSRIGDHGMSQTKLSTEKIHTKESRR